MNTVLQMMFVTEGAKVSTFTVDTPAENLTDQQVSAAMDTILEQDVLSTTSGLLEAKKAAQFVTKTVREVVLT